MEAEPSVKIEVIWLGSGGWPRLPKGRQQIPRLSAWS